MRPSLHEDIGNTPRGPLSACDDVHVPSLGRQFGKCDHCPAGEVGPTFLLLNDEDEDDHQGNNKHNHRWQEHGSSDRDRSRCRGLIVMIGFVLGRVCFALIHG